MCCVCSCDLLWFSHITHSSLCPKHSLEQGLQRLSVVGEAELRTSKDLLLHLEEELAQLSQGHLGCRERGNEGRREGGREEIRYCINTVVY